MPIKIVLKDIKKVTGVVNLPDLQVCEYVKLGGQACLHFSELNDNFPLLGAFDEAQVTRDLSINADLYYSLTTKMKTSEPGYKKWSKLAQKCNNFMNKRNILKVRLDQMYGVSERQRIIPPSENDEEETKSDVVDLTKFDNYDWSQMRPI